MLIIVFIYMLFCILKGVSNEFYCEQTTKHLMKSFN